MESALTSYFDGERQAGLMLGILGVMNLLVAGLLLAPRLGLRGLAITLTVWGVLQLAVGLGLHFKTRPQTSHLAEQLASNPTQFFADESTRMHKVQRNFVVMEFVWGGMIFFGCTIALWRKNDPTVSGIALGILINAAVMLSFDVIAERRGGVYLQALKSSQAMR